MVGHSKISAVRDRRFSHPNQMRKEKGSNLLTAHTGWYSITEEINRVKINHHR